MGAYAASYLVTQPVLGAASGALGCVPALSAGWLWGARAGAIAGLAVGALDGVHALAINGAHELPLCARIAPFLLALMGWAVGRYHQARTQREQLEWDRQRLAAELALTRAELEREVEERAAARANAMRAQEHADAEQAAQAAQALQLEARIALEQQLFKAQKMEAIGRLAGGVAHDFNNLLTAIIGFSDLAATKVGEGRSEAIEQIRKAAERAAELTRALLAFARQEPVRAAVLDVNQIVNGAERLLERLIGEDITLVLALSEETWPVKVGAAQLEQVIVNLAVNARDAMPAGGMLSVSTTNVEHEHGDFVRIRVSDTGIGMDPATISRLFEPFFTTKPDGSGTGLGLATSYGIVAQAGGHIRVESRPGGGTTFDVELPRASEEQEVVKSRTPVSGTVAHGRETVLVVEDEPLVRSIIELTLVAHGYRVLTADAAAQARELLQSHREIELVVTDVILPGQSGGELTQLVRESACHVAVLCISGYSVDTLRERGNLAEECDFLAKPFKPEALLAKVRTVLDQRSHGRRPMALRAT